MCKEQDRLSIASYLTLGLEYYARCEDWTEMHKLALKITDEYTARKQRVVVRYVEKEKAYERRLQSTKPENRSKFLLGTGDSPGWEKYSRPSLDRYLRMGLETDKLV